MWGARARLDRRAPLLSAARLAVVGRAVLSLTTMQPLKAHVHNGRLVLDEPTNLPEGEVVYLQPMAAIVGDGDDDFEDEERQALHRALDEGIAAARAGDHVDAEDFVRALLARK